MFSDIHARHCTVTVRFVPLMKVPASGSGGRRRGWPVEARKHHNPNALWQAAPGGEELYREGEHARPGHGGRRPEAGARPALRAAPRVPRAFPIACVHDEVAVECGEDAVAAVAAWLVRAIKDGMAKVLALEVGGAEGVPIEVEVKTGRTWSEQP